MERITSMAARFRGFLPVVVDVESGGLNPRTHALLEVAAVLIGMDENGILYPKQTYSAHIEPYPGLKMDPKSMAVTGIQPDHPFRLAVSEHEALSDMFKIIREEKKLHDCNRAILVGHNAFFDLEFINAAVDRNALKSPFHPFSTFDTVSLAGLAYGQTVLAKAMSAAKIAWDGKEAHSARYDTEKTAELFCKIVNTWTENIPMQLVR